MMEPYDNGEDNEPVPIPEEEPSDNPGNNGSDDSKIAHAETAVDELVESDHPDNEEPSPDDSFLPHSDDQAPSIVSELEYQKGRELRDDDDEPETLELSGVVEARAVLEGFLFSSNEPLSVQKLSKLLNNLHPRTVRGLLLELQMEYDTRPGALQIVEIANGFQICTRPHLAPWMFRLHKHRRRSPLSPATLETLAIIAYRQPMTKAEIEAIRGVESGAALRTLQDLNLVEVSGRREVIGRPQLFSTTEQFLKVFGLKTLADLPSIAELRTRFSEEQKLKRAKTEPEKESTSQPEGETQNPENPANPESADEYDQPSSPNPDAEVDGEGLGDENPGDEDSEDFQDDEFEQDDELEDDDPEDEESDETDPDSEFDEPGDGESDDDSFSPVEESDDDNQPVNDEEP